MAVVSKNVYFDVLDNIVDKCNNKVHRTIKMKPIDVTSNSCCITMKTLMKKVLNLKLVIVSEYQNKKTFLLKDLLQIGQKKFLSSAKLKTQSRGHTRLVI